MAQNSECPHRAGSFLLDCIRRVNMRETGAVGSLDGTAEGIAGLRLASSAPSALRRSCVQRISDSMRGRLLDQQDRPVGSSITLVQELVSRARAIPFRDPRLPERPLDDYSHGRGGRSQCSIRSRGEPHLRVCGPDLPFATRMILYREPYDRI